MPSEADQPSADLADDRSHPLSVPDLAAALDRILGFAQQEPPSKEPGHFLVVCPKCARAARLTSKSLHLHESESEGLYAIEYECPHCHHEEDI